MHQLEFSWKDEKALVRELERLLGHRVTLVVTDNTSTMMTVRREKRSGDVRLRLHRMFLTADPKVVRALGDWVQKPRCKASGAVIDEFIRQHRYMIRSRREGRLVTEGICHDLQKLYNELNRLYFANRVVARITWGRMPPSRRRRSIRFGSYTVEDNLIRIHPLLDQDFVPRYFVRYIVFHEMLHAFLGVNESPSGRRCVHTREFRELECAYPGYKEALAWQNNPANLRKLLR